MEPVVNKLQEGVKYPRFERDATKTINDLVEHITKERGVYSSSIEPNPNEHSVWFNTDTNTLMIYNNHVWRDFSGSSSGWSVENTLLHKVNNVYTIRNIKDKTFYILNVNIESIDYIEIPNLSDNIEFYIFIPTMPNRLYFPNSNVITNYDTIVRHTTGNNIVGMSVLAHKVGITIEFSIINEKSDSSNKNYVYNTKLNEVYISYIGTDEVVHSYTATSISDENAINQIEIILPPDIQGEYTMGSFSTDDGAQIVYPPFRYETSDEHHISDMCVFKNPSHEKELKVISSLQNIDRMSNRASISNPPSVAIFDKFNYSGSDICNTYYFRGTKENNSTLIIKDNWYFKPFTTLYAHTHGLSIIIDDFAINTNNSVFDAGSNSYYCNNLVINNSSNDYFIKKLFWAITSPNFIYTDDEPYALELRGASLIYTTNYKSKYIGIPCKKQDGGNHDDILIIIANKLRNDTEIYKYKKFNELGKITIITIPENIEILKNLIDTNIYNNIIINDTLEIESYYDDKGLTSEYYYYTIGDDEYSYSYERYDAPIIA